MIVQKSTTGLYRPHWTLFRQRRVSGLGDALLGVRDLIFFGPERDVAQMKLAIGKLRGGGRIS
ncbi:hypothetical protein [Rhodococcus qingshengii]|uniref:hypothetical protein n=1 Tax=Rhodococcus qingshengii TaxID=334542 RepID=UPI00287F602C|nr:hypothetical protein [Rhodococcus qingshengii]